MLLILLTGYFLNWLPATIFAVTAQCSSNSDALQRLCIDVAPDYAPILPCIQKFSIATLATHTPFILPDGTDLSFSTFFFSDPAMLLILLTGHLLSLL